MMHIRFLFRFFFFFFFFLRTSIIFKCHFSIPSSPTRALNCACLLLRAPFLFLWLHSIFSFYYCRVSSCCMFPIPMQVSCFFLQFLHHHLMHQPFLQSLLHSSIHMVLHRHLALRC